ncbi:MAG: hypothetical protein HON90_10305, partial [Halobacteriovoraceae bacterium]|nr:hypothetical protein [Halobacteriovoraceae bacterium]
SSPIHTKLYKTKFKIKGHYYFNHVHTKISQDNSSVDFLKISPTRTFNLVETFLKRRSYKGSLALCDHDTDKGFDEINKLDQTYLSPLRSVEWGGKTHMALIGIKTNWDNLANGRKYSGEESIIQSRSSNGFRIINHPNKKTPPFPYTSWLDVDGVEVWNTSMESPPFTRLNIKYSNNKEAFKQWTDSLSKGHNYVAMAGSDFHFIIPCYTERTLIYPVNFIPAANKEATKDYLQAGRSSFTTVPAAPNLTLQAKFIQNKTWKHMGENAKGAGFLSVRLYGDFSHTNKRLGGRCYNTIRRFSKLFTFWKKRKWEARFYNKKGDLIAKQAFNPKWYNYKKHLKIEFQYPVSSNDLIRVELWSINRKMKSIALLGATNPVYINRN